MAIGLNDLDPTVAEALTECLHDVSTTGTAVRKMAEEAAAGGLGNMGTGVAGYRQFAKLRKEKAEDAKPLLAALSKQRWLGGGWSSFVPAGAAFACIMAGTQLQNQPWLMGGLFGLSFLFSGGSLWRTSRRDLMVGFRTHLPAEVIQAALPLMTLAPTEHLYLETVALLATMQERVEEQNARNILLRLNELLANNRQLEIQRQRLAEAVGQQASVALEAERAQFSQRLNETEDTVTREALQQSLQMCESRLQDTRTMEQNLQRVTAQQEAVHQTLASAQSALMRMQTTPSLSSPAVEEITQAVTQINQQTYAVEQAVQEVATLTARG